MSENALFKKWPSQIQNFQNAEKQIVPCESAAKGASLRMTGSRCKTVFTLYQIALGVAVINCSV